MEVDRVERRRAVRGPRRPTCAVILLAATLVSPTASFAAEISGGETTLFGPAEPLALRLEAPWSELTRRPEAGRARDGRLVYLGAGGEAVALGVAVETRGKSRLEVCDRPMLTLELNPAEALGTLFEASPRVHLTTLCRDARAYREYLINEYLLYRAWALLAEAALGARLVSIEYADPESRKQPKAAVAFLVEDIGQAASRLGRRWLAPTSIGTAALDGEAAALFSLFQLMIANTDWSLLRGPEGEPCCHNTALLGRSERLENLVPIPYDLDTAGLVDAEYGAPSRRLGIRSTRQRVYRGFCAFNDHLPTAVERLQEARGELMTLFEEAAGVSAGTRRRNVGFLAEFFEIIGDPDLLARKVVSDCR